LGGVADRALRVTLKQAAPIPLDVAFACAPGQVLALFGPSGSGKTTILRSIAGLYSPQVARVTIGTDTWLDAAAGVNVPVHRRQVGFVFQDYALFPHLTALGNVMTALTHRAPDERRNRALELLTLVQLNDHVDRRPSALSGGERQRVAVARALAREPRVLLFDEPFAAVDRSLRRTLHSEIDDIRRSFDIPIVLVTHDFEDVVRLATDLVILQSGQAVASGPIEELTSRPDLPWLREMVGLGSIVEAAVVRTEDFRGLAELAFGGNVLFAPAKGLVLGTRVRVRIPAREVILAMDVPIGLSLHNALPATVSAVEREPTSEQVVVQLRVGTARILAEVTNDAVARLGIVEGIRLYVLIKSMSLEVRTTGADRSSAHPEIETRAQGDERA
jgi:molybdate transport system ATP-binding protein